MNFEISGQGFTFKADADTPAETTFIEITFDDGSVARTNDEDAIMKFGLNVMVANGICLGLCQSFREAIEEGLIVGEVVPA